MNEPKELYFLRFNQDNIIKHLLALEDHSRYLRSDMSPKHKSCLLKHTLQLQEQLSEAVSHSSVVEPNKTAKYQELLYDSDRLKKIVESKSEPVDIIREIRNMRSKYEQIVPKYSVKDCKVCSLGHDSENNSFLNKENHHIDITNNGDSEMETANIVSGIAGGAILAKALDFTASKVSMVNEHKTASNVVVGLAGIFAGSKMKGAGKAAKYLKPALVYGGMFLITSEIVKQITSYTQPQFGFAPRLAVRPAVPMVQSVIRTGHLV